MDSSDVYLRFLGLVPMSILLSMTAKGMDPNSVNQRCRFSDPVPTSLYRQPIVIDILPSSSCSSSGTSCRRRRRRGVFLTNSYRCGSNSQSNHQSNNLTGNQLTRSKTPLSNKRSRRLSSQLVDTVVDTKRVNHGKITDATTIQEQSPLAPSAPTTPKPKSSMVASDCHEMNDTKAADTLLTLKQSNPFVNFSCCSSSEYGDTEGVVTETGSSGTCTVASTLNPSVIIDSKSDNPVCTLVSAAVHELERNQRRSSRLNWLKQSTKVKEFPPPQEISKAKLLLQNSSESTTTFRTSSYAFPQIFKVNNFQFEVRQGALSIYNLPTLILIAI
jgi:hypothetical protein